MRRVAIMLATLQLPIAGIAQSSNEPPFDPVTGYRIAHYRGVVAQAPEGIGRIDTARAEALWRAGASFVDVNPAPGATSDAATGRWHLAEQHASIPGAYWFPETGRGVLTPATEHYLVQGVRRLAMRHPHRPIVVFCQADCWMSWNAALRLHRAGIRRIFWFAEGLDGWRDAKLSVAPVRPS